MAETPMHTVYLTPKQVEALRADELFDGTHSINVTQADLMLGGEYAGHVIVAETMSNTHTHYDRDGKVVKRRTKDGA